MAVNVLKEEEEVESSLPRLLLLRDEIWCPAVSCGSEPDLVFIWLSPSKEARIDDSTAATAVRMSFHLLFFQLLFVLYLSLCLARERRKGEKSDLTFFLSDLVIGELEVFGLLDPSGLEESTYFLDNRPLNTFLDLGPDPDPHCFGLSSRRRRSRSRSRSGMFREGGGNVLDSGTQADYEKKKRMLVVDSMEPMNMRGFKLFFCTIWMCLHLIQCSKQKRMQCGKLSLRTRFWGGSQDLSGGEG